jgi:hypothetical protein
VTTNEEDSRASRLRNWMTSRLSDSDYVTTDQEDSRAAEAELDDLRPRDTQECPEAKDGEIDREHARLHGCLPNCQPNCLDARADCWLHCLSS